MKCDDPTCGVRTRSVPTRLFRGQAQCTHCVGGTLHLEVCMTNVLYTILNYSWQSVCEDK